ncbi:hypothetical protein B0T17DRAFT_528783 [Bombardia bombarda]|uniref:Uncharacterized protein n=1 Tax=Bombardia bombarda TaxID=252184 RepID=A0AA40CAU0_9PEZI|nr:hypothetical protein B0T17DRAFT_528783 [Bombardia bombarda]
MPRNPSQSSVTVIAASGSVHLFYLLPHHSSFIGHGRVIIIAAYLTPISLTLPVTLAPSVFSPLLHNIVGQQQEIDHLIAQPFILFHHEKILSATPKPLTQSPIPYSRKMASHQIRQKSPPGLPRPMTAC